MEKESTSEQQEESVPPVVRQEELERDDKLLLSYPIFFKTLPTGQKVYSM
jgi:hypothetical protein